MKKSNYKLLPEHIRRERAKLLVDELITNGINFSTGVPCAVQKFIIKEFIKSDKIVHVPANRENEAIGIATGAYLGGKNVVVYMQNSGFLNAIHDVTSLLITYSIPILFLVTWRGAPGEDAVHHIIDGRITPDVIKLLKLSYYILEPENIRRSVNSAIKYMKRKHKPSILIVRRGVF